jgi:hypothetical protein
MVRVPFWILLVQLVALATGAAAQTPAAPLPLVRSGEELVFRVQSARFGDIGTAVMRVSPDTVEGRPAYLLTFDFEARVLLFNISDHTRSWLDAETLTTLRFSKDERSPLGRRLENVSVNATDSSWSADGVRRSLSSSDPLDELAFIYLVRGVDPQGEPMELNRHFDSARNPVHICVLGRQTLQIMGQDREATVVQFDVPDTRQRSGRNRLRFYVGDDSERLLLRIDSSMPVAGALVLTLAEVRRIAGSN